MGQTISYWVRVGCRWERVTTSLTRWRSLPHVTLGNGCTRVAGLLPAAVAGAIVGAAPLPYIGPGPLSVMTPGPPVWPGPTKLPDGMGGFYPVPPPPNAAPYYGAQLLTPYWGTPSPNGEGGYDVPLVTSNAPPIPVTPVPEPSSAMLFGSALVALGALIEWLRRAVRRRT